MPRMGEFTFWSEALRLVALVQPPSADVERLFSQLKLILEQVSVRVPMVASSRSSALPGSSGVSSSSVGARIWSACGAFQR